MDTGYHARVTTLTIPEDSAKNNAAVIPLDIGLEMGSPTEGKLKFGLRERRVNLTSGEKPDVIKVSKDVIGDLGLVEDIEVGVEYRDGALHLGPVVGLFMNDRTRSRLTGRKPTRKIMNIIRAARLSHVFLYFFTIDDIVWEEQWVNGLTYNCAKGTWETGKMPFPDVLYDRGGGFTSDSLAKARETRRQLGLLSGLKRINAQHYFDKWDLYRRLSKHKETKGYLPETMLHREGARELQAMFNRYSTVYLKTCTGSNGRGVMRVTKGDPLHTVMTITGKE